MKSTKIVAVAVMFIMLSVAGSCILISTETNAGGGGGESEALAKFNPTAGATDASNINACNTLNGKLTSGEARISMDGTTFVLTLDSIVLDTDTSIISMRCSNENDTDVRVVINGDCTINQLVKKGEESSNGGSSSFAIESKDHKSFTLTGNGKLNVNVTYEAGAENSTSIKAKGMKIASENEGSLTLNFNATAKSSNGGSSDRATFKALSGLVDCKNVTINIKSTNLKIEAISATTDKETKFQVSIEGSNITILGDKNGYGISVDGSSVATIKDSNILIDIDGASTNGGDEVDEVAIEIGSNDSTMTTETLKLDNSSIIAFTPIGISYKSEAANTQIIEEKNGSIMSLNCSKNALANYGGSKNGYAIALSIKIDNSELEMIAAEKMYDVRENTLTVSVSSDIPIKLGATGVNDQFTDNSDPLNPSANNKKAFIGYKLDMVFVSEDHTAILKKERVNANDEYTFTDITYDGNVYSKFKLDGTEYKTGDKYKMTTGVACAQFDCISSGPAPEPEPASSSDFSWPLLIAFLVAILAVAYVGIVSRD